MMWIKMTDAEHAEHMRTPTPGIVFTNVAQTRKSRSFILRTEHFIESKEAQEQRAEIAHILPSGSDRIEEKVVSSIPAGRGYFFMKMQSRT